MILWPQSTHRPPLFILAKRGPAASPLVAAIARSKVAIKIGSLRTPNEPIRCGPPGREDTSLARAEHGAVWCNRRPQSKEPITIKTMPRSLFLRFVLGMAAVGLAAGMFSASAQEPSKRGRKGKAPPPTARIEVTILR